MPLQQVRRVVPQKESTTEPTKNAGKMAKKNHREWSTRGLPNNHTSQYLQSTNNRSTDQTTMINQWKCCVRYVETRRRLARKTRREDNRRIIHGSERICVFAPTKPRRLTTNVGNHPRACAWKKNVLKNQLLFRR